MIKTNRDLMKWLGLKIGDRITKGGRNYTIEDRNGEIVYENKSYSYKLITLVDTKFEITDSPSRVGNLKCNFGNKDSDFERCKECPLKWFCGFGINWIDGQDATLYEVLEKMDIYDQEIYDILKANRSL